MRRSEADLTFDEKYARFMKRHRIAYYLLIVGSLLAALAGAITYAVGVLVGAAFGYSLMRSRHHMELAKLHTRMANDLQAIETTTRDALQAAMLEGVAIGKRMADDAD